MKINIGAGYNKNKSDYISIDYDPNTNPDYILNLEIDKLPFDDNTVEAVIAHHILEHLGEGYFHCLQELYRVCKQNAIIDVIVPHPRHDSFIADPTHKRPITVMGLKMFSKKANKLFKEKNYATSRLADFYNVDFEILDFNYVFDTEHKHSLNNLSSLEISSYSSHHNNIISEIKIKLTVIKNNE